MVTETELNMLGYFLYNPPPSSRIMGVLGMFVNEAAGKGAGNENAGVVPVLGFLIVPGGSVEVFLPKMMT